MITSLKTIEQAIRQSIECVALDHSKTTSETMNMTFDATAIIRVTVDGVNHMVAVKRLVGNGCPSIEEDEKSGYATLGAAMTKVLGSDNAAKAIRSDIDWKVYDTAKKAFTDDFGARATKVASLVNVVRAAEAAPDNGLRGMVTELLVRALLDTSPEVLNVTVKLRNVAQLVVMGRIPATTLDDILNDFLEAYKRIKRTTGIALEALRNAAEGPVEEIGDALDRLFADVVLP